MNHLADKELVRICLEEVSKKMGYADYHALSQREYEYLCDRIEEKTGILISLSTIKRIFGGKFERLPQTATLDALTLFIGYKGWQDFKMYKKLEPSFTSEPAVAEPLSRQEIALPVKKTSRRFFIQATSVVILLSIGTFFFLTSIQQKKISKTEPSAKDIVFSAKKMVSQGIPNSVVFSYNIDELAGDSFFIQQSWDPSHKLPISRYNYTQTDIYFEPGFHKAKLISNDKILKEIEVLIPTQDWIAYTKTSNDRFPYYFNSSVMHDGILGLTSKNLTDNAINPDKERYFLYSMYPQELDVNSDHFTLKARIRMKTVTPNLCPGMIVGVYGDNSMMHFPSTIPGCISEINVSISDQHISGKTSDLSGLGGDILNWQTIEVKVVNRRVTIWMQEKQVLQLQYKEPVGQVRGIGFISNGLCEVDWVELQNSNGEIAYRNDFNQSPSGN
jgi:hypothetical protein